MPARKHTQAASAFLSWNLAGRVVRPAQAFVRTEAAGGVVLLAAVATALAWANSPWNESYAELWGRRLTLDTSWFALEESLLGAVNDGFMTIFFFVAGLEIKREIVHGELASRDRAILPVAAALGGMAFPAGIYAALNAGGEGAHGWGIPMATDIAFALGALSLLGKRVPFGLKVFLLALAISDDLGAIAIIAVFYTDALSLEALAWATGILVVVVAINRAGVRSIDVYAALGVLLWLAVFESGFHATLAGVVLAALTPSRPDEPAAGFPPRAAALIEEFRAATVRGDADAADQYAARLERLSRETESPLDRLERALHPWVSFLIVPAFGLANAGLEINGSLLDHARTSEVALGALAGLLVGKVAGISLASAVAVRLGLARLPAGVTFRHIVGAGCLAGIGFTVSLFVAGLAFEDPALAEEAKAGIFAASMLAAAAGLLFLRFAVRRPGQSDNARSRSRDAP